MWWSGITMEVLVLYNIATQLDKGVSTDLICEEEITTILPLVVDLLRQRAH